MKQEVFSMFAYKTLKSGTDIRGVASEGGGAPINLTDEVVERIAAGFLVWCARPRSGPIFYRG